MPVAVDEEVALVNGATIGSSDPFSRNGNILFGRVIGVGATVDVLWENGQYTETAVAAIAYDKITPGVAAPLVGRVVYPLPAAPGSANTHSPEYRCLVVRVYNRQRDGAGDTATYVLLRNLSTGQMYEALSSTVQVIDGQ